MTDVVNADVVVVGSGLVGLATSFELLRRDLTVAIVGPRTGTHVGQASRAAGAMLTVFSEVEADHPPDRVALEVGERLAAREVYEAWLADIGSASGQTLGLTDGLWVIANGYGDNDRRELGAIAAAAKEHGHVADYADPAEVPGLAPQTRAHDALWLAREASVDPCAIADALGTVLHAHPKCKWADSHATLLREQGEHLAVDAADGSTTLGAHLVLAAGAGSRPGLVSPELAGRIGLPPVVSGRGVSLVVRAPFSLAAAIRTPNRGFACGSHAVPRSDGLTYLGATNRLSTDADYQVGPTLDEIATLIHDGAAELNVRLRQAVLVGARVGHRPVTFDHLPLVGTTHHPMVHVATATYRCGVLLAPRIAQLIADGILEPGQHAMHPYRPTREMNLPGLADVLDTSARGLADLILQPGGHLPPGADELLARLLRAGLSQMADSDSTEAAVVRRLWSRAPMEECVPLLMDAMGRSR